MTPRLLAAFLAATMLGGWAPAGEKCGGSDAKYYDQALSYHLTKSGVPHRIDRDGMVCVPRKHAEEFVAIGRKVDESFYEVAHLLKDSCEEAAFVAWGTKEKLRFVVSQGQDAKGQPGSKLFLIRSFTREEAAANAAKLANDAPKGAACRSTGSAPP